MKNIFLEDILLDKDDMIKYEIVKLMDDYQLKEISSSEISSQLKISLNTAYNLIDEINKDFEQFFDTIFLMVEKGKKLRLISESIAPITYRAHLFRKSILFDFFLKSFFSNEMSFDDFCEEHYISNSTMIRKINSCKIVFQRFNIRFSFSKFQFVGREDNIRNFIYNTLWIGTQGIFWPFDNVNELQMKQLIERKPTGDHFLLNEIIVKQMCFIAAITSLRSANGDLIKPNRRYDLAIDNNKYFNALCYEFQNDDLFDLSKTDLEFMFILTTSKPIFSRVTPYCKYQMRLFEQNIPEICSFCIKLKDYIISNSNLKSEDFSPHMLCNLENITLSTYIQEIPCIKLKYEKNKTYKKFVEILNAFFETTNFSDDTMKLIKYKDLLIEQYAILLLQQFGKMLIEPIVSVGVLWDLERLSLDYLTRSISLLEGVKVSELDLFSDKGEYQLIIATEPIPVPESTVLYVWKSKSLTENIIRIIRMIEMIR